MMGYQFMSEVVTRTTYTFRLTSPITASDLTSAMTCVQRRCDGDDPVTVTLDGNDVVISVTTTVD